MDGCRSVFCSFGRKKNRQTNKGNKQKTKQKKKKHDDRTDFFACLNENGSRLLTKAFLFHWYLKIGNKVASLT